MNERKKYIKRLKWKKDLQESSHLVIRKNQIEDTDLTLAEDE